MLSDGVSTILVVICVIGVWILYHTIFNVVYFDLGRGCIMELIGCTIVGVFVAGILMTVLYKLRYIIVIGLILIIGGVILKRGK